MPRKPDGMMARTSLRAEFQDQGKVHTNADALFRLPCVQCRQDTTTIGISATNILDLLQHELCDSLQETQLADLVLGPLLGGRETGEKPSLQSLRSVSQPSRRLL